MRERQERLLVVHERGLVGGQEGRGRGRGRGWELRERRVSERQVASRDQPALGPEALGEGEVACVAVNRPGREADCRTRRDVAV